MKILSIDTSSSVGGAALFDTCSGLMAQVSVSLQPLKRTHSEQLMSCLDYLFCTSSCPLSQVDIFCITRGPGSFTGLRVGLSTLKGLCFATGKPAVALSTLDVLAWNFPFSSYPVCCLVEARKGEVYGALYRWKDKGFTADIQCSLHPIQEMVERAKGEKTIFTGSASATYCQTIVECLGDEALLAPQDKLYLSPSALACQGWAAASRGEFCDPELLTPLYVQRSQAEEKLEGTHRH